MSADQLSADDELVWSMQCGEVLHCDNDLVMEDSGDVAFKAGKTYQVASMHPIAERPYVKLVDEQGAAHRLEAADIRKYFRR
jgi:hypothetical protein